MTLRRLMLAASCREGAAGPLARRAADDGDFVRALGETDRLLRIAPDDPSDPDDPGEWGARQRIARALATVEPDPAREPGAWRAGVATGVMGVAAAVAVLAPIALWRSASGPAPVGLEQAGVAASGPLTTEQVGGAGISWTLVGSFDQPLRAEAAALAADARDFGRMLNPGLPIGVAQQPGQ